MYSGSGFYYDKKHSIKFHISGAPDDEWLDTWETWRLVPTKLPVVEIPPVRTKFVEIPGRNGQLDITDILTGNPLYEDRTGTWSFYMINDTKSRETLVSDLVNTLNGKKVLVRLADDPRFDYEGRVEITGYSVDKSDSQIQIKYTLRPMKTDNNTGNGLNGYLWDPFNFEWDEVDYNISPPQVKRRGSMM